MEDLLHTAIHHDPGDLERRLCNCGVDGATAVALGHRALGGGGEALLDLLAQFRGRREAHRLGESVVNLGQDLLLHLLHGDGVGHGLPADLIGGVLGVRDVKRHRVAGRRAVERSGELGEDAIGAEFDELVARHGLGERHAIKRAVDVGDDEVAHGGRAVLVLQARALLADAIKLLLHRALRGLGGLLDHLEPGVRAEHRGRGHLQGHGERHTLLRGVTHVHLGVTDGLDAGRHQRIAVPVVERAVERLGEDALAPHALDDHASGNLARAEARKPHARGRLLDGAVELLAHLVLGDRHVDADAIVLEGSDFSGYGHGYSRCRGRNEVRVRGLEPPRVSPPGPKPGASTGSATPARVETADRVSDGTRTHDRLDHNQELYQLSYAHHVAGITPGAGGE